MLSPSSPSLSPLPREGVKLLNFFAMQPYHIKRALSRALRWRYSCFWEAILVCQHIFPSIVTKVVDVGDAFGELYRGHTRCAVGEEWDMTVPNEHAGDFLNDDVMPSRENNFWMAFEEGFDAVDVIEKTA